MMSGYRQRSADQISRLDETTSFGRLCGSGGAANPMTMPAASRVAPWATTMLTTCLVTPNRHSDANLRGALRHRVRPHAVDAG